MNGKAFLDAQAAITQHSTGNSQDVSFGQTLSAWTHDVAISFLNDAYGGSPSADRNLYVNGINVDGAPVDGAAAALLSMSAQHLTVNVPVHT